MSRLPVIPLRCEIVALILKTTSDATLRIAPSSSQSKCTSVFQSGAERAAVDERARFFVKATMLKSVTARPAGVCMFDRLGADLYKLRIFKMRK